VEVDEDIELLGRRWIELWPAASKTLVQKALDDVRSRGSARFSAFCPTARGAPKWWDVVLTSMCDDKGAMKSIVAIARDISAQRESESQLRWASEHDALTNLPNRRAFQARLQAATFRAMSSSKEVGLLLIDLDHFKHVNDSLGHAAGDHLLHVVAERLQQSVRKDDFVARLGGDEFAVIMEGRGDEVDLAGAGQSILKRLHQPISFENRLIRASASIGCARFPSDAPNANQLTENADIALYALKNRGRGGTKLFESGMRQRAQLVSSQLSLARGSLTEKSVEPHYQQKVDLKTGEIKGFEALLRWRHSLRGIQQPDTVAEAFNDFELASKIGELMQRRVFDDVRGWLDQNLPVGRIAINAAPVEFFRDDYAERLLSRMRERHIPPCRVEVEVTEHVFFERGSEHVQRALKQLHLAGVKIALDDFGTGYSSLSHLRDLPVSVVKIDRSFIAKLTEDPEIRAIVSAVIDLSRCLNIEVVAEGVETEAHRRVLIQDGCPIGQGYLFGRAVDADQVPYLLGGLVRHAA
jgi:diguanylate cyclase (GGDEF)-like protein